MVSGGWPSVWEKTGKTGNAMAKARLAQKSRTDTRHPLVLRGQALTTHAERKSHDLVPEHRFERYCGVPPVPSCRHLRFRTVRQCRPSWCGYLIMIKLAGHILVIRGIILPMRE
jgi:hypothetical protein